MELSQILGWVATILFIGMVIPQFIKTYKRKSVEDVSIWMFLVALVANLVALSYAVLIKQDPLIIKYILGIFVTLAYIILWVRVKER